MARSARRRLTMTAERLAEILRLRIGHYVPGSKLPGREALARYFRVPSHVARRALKLLADQGVIATTNRREAVVPAELSAVDSIRRVKALFHRGAQLYTFQQEVLLGADQRCRRLGLKFEVVPGQPDLGRPDILAEIAGRSLSGTGWMFLNLVPPDASLLLWRLEGVPLVLVDDHSPTQPVSSVRFDVQRAMYEATHTLALLGHRRLAYIGDQQSQNVVSLDRRRGFRLACERHGVNIDPALLWHNPGEDSIGVRQIVRSQLAATDSPPTAIVATDVPSGCDAIAACEDLGLSVPGQVSVVSGGSTPITALANMDRLSRFDHGPRAHMGLVAIDLLVESTRRPSPVQLMIGCTWHDAGSVGPPRQA